MKINNRRYIGCKTKLLSFIYNTVLDKGYSKGVFADIFAGTGAVANYFAEQGFETILNDTLYSNVVAYKAFLGSGEIRSEFLLNEIKYFNSLDGKTLINNYFSDVYGEKYFSVNDAKIIGYIRDFIENNRLKYNEREYYYLLTSLIYAADKIANTVGHFESYLKKAPQDKGVELLPLELSNVKVPAKIYNEDANILAKKISADIVYIDPPYNARQYVNFYHVLENLARWNKPTEFEGNSMKFKRNELKSDYCRPKAPLLMCDLIKNLDCKLMVISYSNTYSAGSSSSINCIQGDEIIAMLQTRGRVSVYDKDYQFFNAGKSDLKGHKELLYVCEVGK